MTDLTDKCDVCIVVVYGNIPKSEGLGMWIFGVYENEELARKRVIEQDYLLSDDCTVKFYNETVWRVKE